VSGSYGDLLRRRARRDPERDRGVPEVVETQRTDAGGLDCREPVAASEERASDGPAFGRGKHELVRPQAACVLGELVDDEAGERNVAAAGLRLRWAEVVATTYFDRDLGDVDASGHQIDAVAAEPEQLTSA